MEITLIRHTRVAIPPGIVYGATDVNVASTFEEEAQIVAYKRQKIRCCIL